MSYLQKYPVDLLKLARSFTSELGPNPGADAIPAAVLQLARAMSLGVIAEGVETLDQQESLLDLGFHQAQGHLFASARPAAELAGLCTRSNLSSRLLRSGLPSWMGTCSPRRCDALQRSRLETR